MTLSEIVESIHNLEQRMQEFERRYNLLSDDFYGLAQEGRLEQSADFIRWLGYYELWLDRKRWYQELLAERFSRLVVEPVALERVAA
ncbi:MAG: hypothetical protein H8D78_09105 [Chloroflexi bacterium]|nr:hypothetical protein [Chloroflexota bacterium]